MTNISSANSSRRKKSLVTRFIASVRRLPLRIARLLNRWEQRNHNRQAMAQMGDHLRKDIGLNRYDWKREIAKPFWRD